MGSDSRGESVALRHPLDRHVRLLLQVAMLLFVYTIVIGILNGLDLVEFTRPQLLSHLHGGTLGWMTLSILAVTLWLFSPSGAEAGGESVRSVRVLSVVAAASIAAYVAAFATTTGFMRPLAGTATLVSLAGIAVWAFGRARQVSLTVPRLLILLGLASSVIGGLFGVVNGLAIAFTWTWVPTTFFGAHAATMEAGFIIPAALGVAEWGLRRSDEPATRSGKIQVGLMALAFLWLLVLILADAEEIAGMGILFAIAGVVIFFVRMGRHIRWASLGERSETRHALAGGVFVGVTLVYIFVMLQLAGGDFGAVPHERFVAFIHLMAVGGTTNALLAFVIHLSRRVSAAGVIDDVVFWGVNVGLLGFVVALTAEARGLIFVFVPIMGLALLAAIAAHIVPLGRDVAHSSATS